MAKSKKQKWDPVAYGLSLNDGISNKPAANTPTAKETALRQKEDNDYLKQFADNQVSTFKDYGPSFANSEYIEDFNFESGDAQEVVEDVRAENMPGWDKFKRGTGRAVVKLLTEVAKLPFVVGGLIGGIGGEMAQWVDGDEEAHQFFKTAFDNQWIQTLDKIDEEAKAAMPVYMRESVREGSLMDHLTSGEFWATDGADGIGFMASMFVPGTILSKIGAGARIANGLARGSKALSVFSKSEKVSELLMKGGKFFDKASVAEKISQGSFALANTFVEAGSEAKEAGHTMLNEIKLGQSKLKEQFEAGSITQEQFDEQNKVFEDNKKKTGDAMASTFWLNAGILGISNGLQAKTVLGLLGERTVDAAVDVNRVVSGATKSLSKQVLNVGKKVGTSIVSEGFWEEGAQGAVSNYAVKRALGQTEDDWLTGSVKEYADGLHTLEGQKAIALGAILGGGMTSIHAVGEEMKDTKNVNDWRDIHKELNKPNMFTILNEDPYVYENGKRKTVKDGKFELDLNKSKELAKSFAKSKEYNEKLELAEANNDVELYNEVKDEIIQDQILEYAKLGRTGIELFNATTDHMLENSYGLGAKYGTELQQKQYEEEKAKKEEAEKGEKKSKLRRLRESLQDKVEDKTEFSVFQNEESIKAKEEERKDNISKMKDILKHVVEETFPTTLEIHDRALNTAIKNAFKNDKNAEFFNLAPDIQKKISKQVQQLAARNDIKNKLLNEKLKRVNQKIDRRLNNLTEEILDEFNKIKDVRKQTLTDLENDVKTKKITQEQYIETKKNINKEFNQWNENDTLDVQDINAQNRFSTSFKENDVIANNYKKEVSNIIVNIKENDIKKGYDTLRDPKFYEQIVDEMLLQEKINKALLEDKEYQQLLEDLQDMEIPIDERFQMLAEAVEELITFDYKGLSKSDDKFYRALNITKLQQFQYIGEILKEEEIEKAKETESEEEVVPDNTDEIVIEDNNEVIIEPPVKTENDVDTQELFNTQSIQEETEKEVTSSLSIVSIDKDGSIVIAPESTSDPKFLEFQNSPIDKRGLKVKIELGTPVDTRPEQQDALDAFKRDDTLSQIQIDVLPLKATITLPDGSTTHVYVNIITRKNFRNGERVWRNNVYKLLKEGKEVHTRIKKQKNTKLVQERIGDKISENSILDLFRLNNLGSAYDLILGYVNAKGELIGLKSKKQDRVSSKGYLFIDFPLPNGGVIPLKLNVKMFSENITNDYLNLLQQINNKFKEGKNLEDLMKQNIMFDKLWDTTGFSQFTKDFMQSMVSDKGGLSVGKFITLALYNIDSLDENVERRIKHPFEIQVGQDGESLFINSNLFNTPVPIDSVDEIKQVLQSKRFQINISEFNKNINYRKFLLDNNILNTDLNVSTPFVNHGLLLEDVTDNENGRPPKTSAKPQPTTTEAQTQHTTQSGIDKKTDIERRKQELGLQKVLNIYPPDQSGGYRIKIKGDKYEVLVQFTGKKWDIFPKQKNGDFQATDPETGDVLLINKEQSRKLVEKYLPKELIDLIEQAESIKGIENQEKFEQGKIKKYVDLFRIEWLQERMPIEKELLEFYQSDKFDREKEYKERIIKAQQEVIAKYDTELKKLEQPTQSESNPVLRDVDSTAKALDKLPREPQDKIYPNKIMGIEGIPLSPLSFDGNVLSWKSNDSQSVAEAYHKAKADESNPELVKAVESLLSKEQSTSTTKSEIDKKAEDVVVGDRVVVIFGKKPIIVTITNIDKSNPLTANYVSYTFDEPFISTDNRGNIVKDKLGNPVKTIFAGNNKKSFENNFVKYESEVKTKNTSLIGRKYGGGTITSENENEVTVTIKFPPFLNKNDEQKVINKKELLFNLLLEDYIKKNTSSILESSVVKDAIEYLLAQEIDKEAARSGKEQNLIDSILMMLQNLEKGNNIHSGIPGQLKKKDLQKYVEELYIELKALEETPSTKITDAESLVREMVSNNGRVFSDFSIEEQQLIDTVSIERKKEIEQNLNNKTNSSRKKINKFNTKTDISIESNIENLQVEEKNDIFVESENEIIETNELSDDELLGMLDELNSFQNEDLSNNAPKNNC